MKTTRLAAIHTASSASLFGVVLGTLGRQGSPQIFARIRALLALHHKRCVLFLMAELNPAKLAAIAHIEAWVQVSCPRLSIDWGAGFVKVSEALKEGTHLIPTAHLLLILALWMSTVLLLAHSHTLSSTLFLCHAARLDPLRAGGDASHAGVARRVPHGLLQRGRRLLDQLRREARSFGACSCA
jgi:hypothetical protein